jgi:hypothetical protein
MAAPANFNALIAAFQTCKRELIPDHRVGPKEVKIIQGDCKDM